MEYADEVSSVAELLRPFLRQREKILVCYYSDLNCTLWKSAAAAAEQLGGDVSLFDGRQTWQALLRQAFSQRATVLIGAPRMILGIAKIARATGTPLPVRHVVLLGCNQEAWLHKGIEESLDAIIHVFDMANRQLDPLFARLDEMLLSWSSVLDYHAKRTEQGLRLEIVVFPGRQLPKLPSGASITVRPWRPGVDIPYCLPNG